MLFVINEILILHSDSSNRKGKLDEYNYPVFAELLSSQSCQHLGTLLGPKKKRSDLFIGSVRIINKEINAYKGVVDNQFWSGTYRESNETQPVHFFHPSTYHVFTVIAVLDYRIKPIVSFRVS